MHISQPAVTKQINALEQEIGVSLFIRTTRHVELTSAGMAFYKDARDIVAKSQMAVNRAQKHGLMSDSIRIGLSSPIALFSLKPILEQFHAKHPDIQPVIEIPGYKIALNLFVEKKLDLLFYYRENLSQESGIAFIELKKERLSCLMPDNHPLAEKGTVTLEDIAEETIIACSPLNAPLSIAAFQQHLEARHSADKIFYCDTIEAAHCMAAAGMGVSIFPDSLCLEHPDFRKVPFSDAPLLSFGIFIIKLPGMCL